MIHGTPVLDIKPYIADYDSPQNLIEPLGDFNLQNNQCKPKTVSQCDGKTDSCDQQQLSGYEEPRLYSGTKEKPKCPEDRTSGENNAKHDNSAKIQQSSPEPRERAADLGEESESGPSPRVAEEQSGPCCLEKSFSEEQADSRLRRGEAAVVPQGHSTEVPPEALPCPSRAAGAAHRSAVPAWVREAPVATLGVRFTPHAEMDLEHLSSGEPGTFHFLFLNER